ncbi:hypothetical protein [Geothrix oryzisoli]|uniref:hypothetical protein n=1 Tax=Geothrix oryzisoli TaxID=2922721 RepID=UPI001FAC5544|nr:hypothetical protein [Geothrix oryzisoli]
MAEKATLRPGESAPKSEATRKTVGEAGIYVTNPKAQPTAVIVLTGLWDAVAAAYDALGAGDPARYVFASCPDCMDPNILRDTLETLYPGVPRLIITDQDPSGQKARKKFAKVGTLAILPGTGLAKDYREADPKKRWAALLDGIERALENGNPAPRQETGVWKIARRVLEGTMAAKAAGKRDLEAWRQGQRCGGMCRATTGGRNYFSTRANLYGQMVTAEGQHAFGPILEHTLFHQLEQKYPDLADVIRGGPTEHPLSPQWHPPTFLEDGRHWSEIVKARRTAYAREHGWAEWPGKDPGQFKATDLEALVDRMRSAYLLTRIPNAPDSEAGLRMTIWCLALALCALRAEELWAAGVPTGFLPWIWFFGGPATGKGTALKVVAACLTGDLRTYGSQRFGGDEEYDWLTESVLHLPICVRDELDSFMKGRNIEDLKTFLAGEALQLRKKFGTDMAISPRPVVIASNTMHLNQEDEASQERVTLVELQPNSLAPSSTRNNAFESFHTWLEREGKDLLYRLTLHLYKEFRALPTTKSRNSRSAMLDAAVSFLSGKLHINPDEVFRPSVENKDEAILRSAPWFTRLVKYAQHEIGTQSSARPRVLDVWGLRLDDPNQKRTYYRYLDAFQKAAGSTGVPVGRFLVTISSTDAGAASRFFTFSQGDAHATA